MRIKVKRSVVVRVLYIISNIPFIRLDWTRIEGIDGIITMLFLYIIIILINGFFSILQMCTAGVHGE